MNTILFIGLSLLAFITNASTHTSVESDKHHQLFDAVLNTHVNNGHVDYAGIQTDTRFFDYLAYLENAQPKQLETNKEQLAFWINAYNALSIKGILDGKSPSSLLGRYKFFISTKYTLAGQSTSLDNLEKKIIIPYDEPLIHFAIVCASASCPKLISEAYSAEKLDEQMRNNAIAFINNPDKNQLDISSKKIKVSKIFKWFKKDFSNKSGSVQQYIAQFIDDEALSKKLNNNEFKVKHLKYDWNLNGTPPTKK